ncbi:MAG: hypothetical protein JXA17_02680 [Dehalococcoidales bacterium]|nr:hypothetical protein [Dehalococcoidales bacterium]
MLKDTKLGSSFKKKVIEYIERCHLEDGGYFFARIPPSSGTDTRIAVKSLAIFGSMPGNPDSIMNFFLNQVKDETLNDINGIFNAIEVIAELGRISPGLRNYARDRIMFRQNEAGGFGNLEDIDVEVASELQQTYQAVKVLKVIGAPFDESKVNRFISSLLNHDGGYGRNGHSTLASTFYATAIYKLLGVNCPATSSTVSYLKKKKNYRMQFIEDLFWMVKSLVNLGERFHFRNEHINFVLKCQRDNGGFSRAPVMGIPTLEYTYYALNILNEAGLL